MISTKHILHIFILLGFISASCGKNTINPENIFTRIYNDPNSDISYYPLDLVQTKNGEYYILGATAIDTTRTWLSTYVSKVDAFGNLLWDSSISAPYMNPVAELINPGSDIYFFCMDQITLGTHLMKLNEDNNSIGYVSLISNRL